ncbi:MAG: membrane protein insertase YidC [Flavobacteriales bacterium]|nr:membrane protein insertase YidC [Flavobacteriales bacterium]|tara:strand:- start:44892 stop:46706 length:1815 start_codon:yes stop_codon:yes gene_type:complete
MDRNSITGIILIALLVVGYNIIYPPVVEEKTNEQDNTSTTVIVEETIEEKPTSEVADTNNESMSSEERISKYGAFAMSAYGSDDTIIIENDKLELHISAKGGRITAAILKEYQTSDSLPLNLIDKDSSAFNLKFFSENRVINTEDLYFTSNKHSSQSVSMKLMAEGNRFLEYVYTLKEGDYMMDFHVNSNGLNSLIPSNQNALELDWVLNLPHTEKSLDNERMYSTVYYKYLNDDVDYLSETKNEEEELNGKAQWIGFKHQFFSSVLINNNGFDRSAIIKAETHEGSKKFVRELSANITLPYTHKSEESIPLQFYFGPNHYQSLSTYNMDLERMIPLGWGIFRWVNKYAVIPMFNWLDNSITNYGIIILIMTIIIKMVLAPFTLKAYKSQAKMKVLKPEMDKIQEKHKEKDPMKAQQEVMALYKKTGVNPLGGCLPMLLQMPILFAMFRFFPASIELRQKSFLWADDLSSYDSIMSLPFEIPFYGDHVSLFTLLMTVSTILYTRMNSQMSGPQMAQMKWMMYLMPIMFLGFFNNYAAGLSYYYFLANMITFGQQFVMRKFFIDENAIIAQIENNKKKPTKKSKFQKRLEEMARKQQEAAKKRGR